MPRKLMMGFAGATLWLASVGANAIEIFVDPSAQMVELGEEVRVDVNIRDLGMGVAPSVSGFDITVEFDTSVLDFSTVEFGDQLDLGFGSFSDFVEDIGAVDIFEVSLAVPEFDEDIDPIQLNAFTLFTLTLDTVATGLSPINLTLNQLVDADDLPAGLTADLNNGEIDVRSSTGIPEPATLTLIGLGFIGFGFRRYRRINTQ